MARHAGAGGVDFGKPLTFRALCDATPPADDADGARAGSRRARTATSGGRRCWPGADARPATALLGRAHRGRSSLSSRGPMPSAASTSPSVRELWSDWLRRGVGSGEGSGARRRQDRVGGRRADAPSEEREEKRALEAKRAAPPPPNGWWRGWRRSARSGWRSCTAQLDGGKYEDHVRGRRAWRIPGRRWRASCAQSYELAKPRSYDEQAQRPRTSGGRRADAAAEAAGPAAAARLHVMS